MNSGNKAMALLGGVATSAVVVALTAGIGLAAAAPAPSGATLFMCPDNVNTGSYRTTIRGVFPMSEADAIGYLIHINDNAQPGGIEYHVVADDEDGYSHDGDLYSRFFPHTQTDSAGYLRAGPAGVEYSREFLVPRNKFNEDDGEDEVYAAATFRDADGGRRQQFSQKVVRHFEAAGICDKCCS